MDGQPAAKRRRVSGSPERDSRNGESMDRSPRAGSVEQGHATTTKANRKRTRKLARAIAKQTEGGWAKGVISLAERMDAHAVHIAEGRKLTKAERAKCAQCRADMATKGQPRRQSGGLSGVPGSPDLEKRGQSERTPDGKDFKKRRRRRKRSAVDAQEREWREGLKVRRIEKTLRKAENGIQNAEELDGEVTGGDAGPAEDGAGGEHSGEEGLRDGEGNVNVNPSEVPSTTANQQSDGIEVEPPDLVGDSSPVEGNPSAIASAEVRQGAPPTLPPNGTASGSAELSDEDPYTRRSRIGWSTRRKNERTAQALLQVMGSRLERHAEATESAEERKPDPEKVLRGLELHAYNFYDAHNAIDLPRKAKPQASARRRELEEAGAFAESSQRTIKQPDPLRFADGKLFQPAGGGYRTRDMYEAMDPAALAALGSMTEELVASGLKDTVVAVVAQQMFLSREAQGGGQEGIVRESVETRRLRATALAAASAAEEVRRGRVPDELSWMSPMQQGGVKKLLGLMDEWRNGSVEKELLERRARVSELVKRASMRHRNGIKTRAVRYNTARLAAGEISDDSEDYKEESEGGREYGDANRGGGGSGDGEVMGEDFEGDRQNDTDSESSSSGESA